MLSLVDACRGKSLVTKAVDTPKSVQPNVQAASLYCRSMCIKPLLSSKAVER